LCLRRPIRCGVIRMIRGGGRSMRVPRKDVDVPRRRWWSWLWRSIRLDFGNSLPGGGSKVCPRRIEGSRRREFAPFLLILTLGEAGQSDGSCRARRKEGVIWTGRKRRRSRTNNKRCWRRHPPRTSTPSERHCRHIIVSCYPMDMLPLFFPWRLRPAFPPGR
jgi:hypothetical protein